jgi:hypothetical protein
MTNQTQVQHTPGPYLRDGATIYALTPNSTSVGPPEINRWSAHVQRQNGTDGAGADECEAVARLFQSAPDLLAALEYLVTIADDEGWSSFILGDAQAAIRRARGED